SSHPEMPWGLPTWPSVSAGPVSAPGMAGSGRGSGVGSRLLAVLAHQVTDALGLLCALRHPVIDAFEVQPQLRLGLAGLGIEETHLLQALAALALAMVGHHHVEIGIVARTAPCQTNGHHARVLASYLLGLPKRARDSTQIKGL